MSRAYLDFKAIRERVPFLGVLSHYGLEVRRVNTTQFKGKCPLPSHSNGKDVDTFYINTDKNVFCCHSDSCKKAGDGASGNVLDFVRLMEGVQAYEAAAKLNEWYPDGSVNKESHVATSTPEVKSEVNHFLAFQLKDVNPVHPLIQAERGISEETAEKYGIGFFPGKGSMAGRIVFPLYEYLGDASESPSLVGYAGRAVSADLQPKWLLPKGLVKSFVYGLEHCDPEKPLVLCESFWAPAFFHERGIQAASLMGCELTEAQVLKLRAFATICVALDNDQAGNEKAAAVVQRLRAAGHKVLKARLME
jgi:DNA primase